MSPTFTAILFHDELTSISPIPRDTVQPRSRILLQAVGEAQTRHAEGMGALWTTQGGSQGTRRGSPVSSSHSICDLAPQNELKVAKYSLLVIPTKVACLLTYSLKDAGFV